MQKQNVESSVFSGGLFAAPAETEIFDSGYPENVDSLIDRLDSLVKKMRGQAILCTGDSNISRIEPVSDVEPLPEGYAGDLLVEMEEAAREEEETCKFMLARARTLAWEAVRSTPGKPECAGICKKWLERAALWARRRELEELSATLEHLLRSLDESLPLLSCTKN